MVLVACTARQWSKPVNLKMLSRVLLLLVPVQAQLCRSSRARCIPQNDCNKFMHRKQELLSFEKGTDDYTDLLRELSRLVCNKERKSVCCEDDLPCQPGMSCKHERDCPLYSLERAQLKHADEGSRDFREILEDLKKRVCNVQERKVCCLDLFNEDLLDEDS